MTEKEEIQMCLTCPLPECCNCLGGRSATKEFLYVGRLRRLRQLCEYNLTDAQMADILGVHLNTVWDMRRKMGIPGLKERQRARAERV